MNTNIWQNSIKDLSGKIAITEYGETCKIIGFEMVDNCLGTFIGKYKVQLAPYVVGWYPWKHLKLIEEVINNG